MNKQDEARIRKIVAEELAKAGVRFLPLPSFLEPKTGDDLRWTGTTATSARQPERGGLMLCDNDGISFRSMVRKGCWTYKCCEEDLRQITTDDEVEELLAELADKENGPPKPKVFSSRMEALNHRYRAVG